VKSGHNFGSVLGVLFRQKLSHDKQELGNGFCG